MKITWGTHHSSLLDLTSYSVNEDLHVVGHGTLLKHLWVNLIVRLWRDPGFTQFVQLQLVQIDIYIKGTSVCVQAQTHTKIQVVMTN